MASILNWKQDELLNDRDRAGKFMETFVFQELSVQIDLDKYAFGKDLIALPISALREG